MCTLQLRQLWTGLVCSGLIKEPCEHFLPKRNSNNISIFNSIMLKVMLLPTGQIQYLTNFIRKDKAFSCAGPHTSHCSLYYRGETNAAVFVSELLCSCVPELNLVPLLLGQSLLLYVGLRCLRWWSGWKECSGDGKIVS